MICERCAKAADKQTEVKRTRLRQRGGNKALSHPESCGCTCQHKPVGSIEILRNKDE